MTKYLYFLITFLLSVIVINAQFVTIPDQDFRDALKNRYPGCFNSANQLDTTCAAIVNDTSLRISGAAVAPGDIYPANAQNFEGLQYFKKLKSLYIGETLVKKIPKLAAQLNSSLRTLIISINPFLDSVPPIPDSVTYIQFFLNSLDYLPSLPSTLVYLNCEKNNISIIPTLPSSLIQLSCSFNNISLIPPLPNKLLWLECAHNKISSLPFLPPALTRLWCGYNNISNLPSYPDSLRELTVDHNIQLSSLQANFPSRLNSLNVDSSGIKCLPVLPVSLTSLILDTNIVRCIPNNFNTLSVYQEDNSRIINNPRLCNVTTNVNGCTAYPVIAGYAFYDANSNGIKDANEYYKANTKIQLSNGNITFTNDSGYYEIGTTALGSYTVTPSNTFFNVVPASKTVNFISYDTTVFQNFAYRPTSIVDSMEVIMTQMFSWAVKPGRLFGYWIDTRNVGSGNFGPTTIQLTYDINRLTYDSVSNPAFVRSGNKITLNLSSLPIGQCH